MRYMSAVWKSVAIPKRADYSERKQSYTEHKDSHYNSLANLPTYLVIWAIAGWFLTGGSCLLYTVLRTPAVASHRHRAISAPLRFNGIGNCTLGTSLGTKAGNKPCDKCATSAISGLS